MPLYRLDDLGIRIQINPVKETRKLALTFPLPNVDEYYDKPLTFLSHLIGYEGDGSLLSPAESEGLGQPALRRRRHQRRQLQGFWRQLRPDPLGLEHVNEIVAALFGYLKLIERGGVEAWRYDEAHRA